MTAATGCQALRDTVATSWSGWGRLDVTEAVTQSGS